MDGDAERSAARAATRPASKSSPGRAMFPVDFAIFVPLDWRCAQCSQVWTNGSPVAASLWAISSSWCGKIRSIPPVWMSKDGPRWAMLIAEHSMCQPGRPSPIAVDHDGSPGLAPFHRAKSRTSSLAYSSASTRSPTRSSSGSSLASLP